MGLIDEIAQQVSGGKGPYILIEDFAHLKTATIRARRFFIGHMIKNKRIAALIFCNASLMFRIVIKIGSRLNTTSREVFITDHYAEAVNLAKRLSDDHKLDTGAYVFGQPMCYCDKFNSLAPIELYENSDWDILSEEYTNRFQVIDRRIMHSVSEGYLRKDTVHVIDSMREHLFKDSAANHRIQYLVLNAHNLKGGSRNARKAYILSLKNLHHRYPIRMYTLYGANTFMRTAARITGSFLPFRLALADDLSHAFELIHEDRGKDSAAVHMKHIPERVPDSINHHVEELLTYIGGIDWEKEGIESSPEIEADHPFLILFQAIKYIKDELDDLFQERGQQEAELKKSEEKYRELFEKGSDLLCFHDLEGNIMDTNITFKTQYGWVLDPSQPPNIKNFIPERYYPQYQDYLKRIKRNGKDKGIVRGLLNNGREIILEYDNVLVKDASGKPIGVKGSARDITERFKAVKEKEQLQDNLRQAHKMEAVGTLAGGVAHDFNNILGIIIGNAELALDDIPEQLTAHQNLAEIKTACVRARDIVKQLLSFSRKTETRQKTVRVDSLVRESLKLLRATIPTSINISLNVSKDIKPIKADPTQIHQIIINLCTNAYQAMADGGGSLEISLNQVDLVDADAMQNYNLSPGQYVQLTVVDSGKGIDPLIQDRIFEPYFTTKEVGKGTGMGLAVVHGIVKQHKGAITVSSKPGKSTTVEVIFPVIDEPQVEDVVPLNDLPAGNETVLFIDDETLLVDIGRQILEKLGYQVIAINNPLDAIELLRAEPTRFDLIVTDMTMPHITGDILILYAKEIQPDIPIILCTGFSEKIDEAAAKKIGACKYIEKPLSMEKLAIAVRKALDGE